MDLFDVYPVYDIEIASANNFELTDINGKKYYDFYGGHAVISIGHSHPHYVAKLESQLHKIGFYSNSVKIELQKELALKLGNLSGYDEYSLFLCNSGAEANENAFKLASFHTKKPKIISFTGGFHGRTSLAVAATDNAKIVAPCNQTEHAVILPFDDMAALEMELKKGDTAAVVIEGIQGIGGIVESLNLIQIRELTKKYNALLILDEIQSGFGRSGKFFAHQYHNIRPDIISVAKGMGNGFPVGGILISPEFEASYGLLGTTFGGNYLACQATIAVLDVMKSEHLISNSEKMGAYLMDQLSDIPSIEVRGRGLMIGIEMNEPIAAFRKKLLTDGSFFTGSAKNPNVLRLLPPMTINKEICDKFVQTFKSIYIA